MNIEIVVPTHPTKGLSQAYVLRQLAYDIAVRLATGEVNDEDLEASRGISQAIKSWTEADDRVRIHRNKPLPGSLRPTARKSKRDSGAISSDGK